jgi:hypothetical protein
MEHLKTLINEYKALLDKYPNNITEKEYKIFNQVGLSIDKCSSKLRDKYPMSTNKEIWLALYEITMDGRRIQGGAPRWFTKISSAILSPKGNDPLTPAYGKKLYEHIIEQWSIIDKALKEQLQEVES